MSNVAHFDRDGTYVPFASDDEIIECGANDPLYGPAEEWPLCTDMARWELGPDPDTLDRETFCGEEIPLGLADEWRPEPEPFQPTAEDLTSWAARCDLAEDLEAWNDYEAWLDRLEALATLAGHRADDPGYVSDRARYTDADAAAAGLAVG